MNDLKEIDSPIECLEGRLLDRFPEEIQRRIDECRLLHHFSPGIYIRELRRPPDTFIIGHAHRTEHLNILLSGELNVFMDGKVTRMTAPRIFKSEAGVRKITYSKLGATLLTVHATDETDMDRLEEELIDKSAAFQRHELDEARRYLMEEQP